MNRLRVIILLLSIFLTTGITAAASVITAPEHAVIVYFMYNDKNLNRLFALEDRLETTILKAKVGELDGNEVAVGGGDARIYMYGPDAGRLYKVIESVLKSTPFMRGAKAQLRYGPPGVGAREVIVEIIP